jgi:hypothetical protein
MSLLSNDANRLDIPIDDLTTQLKLVKYDQPSETDDHGKKLQNFRYYTYSELSTPTFINCRLQNVDFVQFKFQNTEFWYLTLTNVLFLHVTCYNITISNLSLKDYLWNAAIAQNALLVHKLTQNIHNVRTTVIESVSPLLSSGALQKVPSSRLNGSKRSRPGLRRASDAMRMNLEPRSK